MTEVATAQQHASFRFQGLLDLVAMNGRVIAGVTIDEMAAINTIREIVNETNEPQVVTYTGS